MLPCRHCSWPVNQQQQEVRRQASRRCQHLSSSSSRRALLNSSSSCAKVFLHCSWTGSMLRQHHNNQQQWRSSRNSLRLRSNQHLQTAAYLRLTVLLMGSWGRVSACCPSVLCSSSSRRAACGRVGSSSTTQRQQQCSRHGMMGCGYGSVMVLVMSCGQVASRAPHLSCSPALQATAARSSASSSNSNRRTSHRQGARWVVASRGVRLEWDPTAATHSSRRLAS